MEQNESYKQMHGETGSVWAPSPLVVRVAEKGGYSSPLRANRATLTLRRLSAPAACSAGARRSLKTNLCKWCDSTPPACEEKVCYSNCNLNSYCEDPYEICVAIW